jgi:hypothetical protein
VSSSRIVSKVTSSKFNGWIKRISSKPNFSNLDKHPIHNNSNIPNDKKKFDCHSPSENEWSPKLLLWQTRYRLQKIEDANKHVDP